VKARVATLVVAVCLVAAAFLSKPAATAGPALRDFESYYAAGATWLYHGDPYGREVWRTERTIPGVDTTHQELLPFVGPPFGLPLWAAISRLAWGAASGLWSVVLGLSLAAIAFGSLKLAKERIDLVDAIAVFAFAAGFGPLTSGLALGQVAVVSCAAIVLTPLVLGSPTAFAATASALIAALQPNLAIVLAARAAGRRAWIAFCFALVLAAGGSALALSQYGGLIHYLDVLRVHAGSERFIAIQTTISSVARGLGASPQASGFTALAVAVAVIAIAAFQILSRRYAPDDRLALACAALPLALPFAHEHDFTIAFLPIVLLVRRARGVAWVAGTIAGVTAGVDWLGLAQRPTGALETILLTAAAACACVVLAREPLRPFHFAPLVVPAAVACAAIVATAHPLPTWPDGLPPHFQVPAALGAAEVWREEQIASGVAGLDPWWAMLRALSLAACAMVWGVASVVLATSRTASLRRSEPSSTPQGPQAVARPSA
jgi:hypothetical protein